MSTTATQENIVKFRLVHFYVKGVDPITRQDTYSERTASHGQRLYTEAGVNDSSGVYSVPQDEIDRLRALGALFDDAEVELMNAGVTDAGSNPTDAVLGDTATSTVGTPDSSATSTFGGGEQPHPLTLEEMSPWQIGEALKRGDLTVESVCEAVANRDTPEAARQLADKVINSATEAYGADEVPDDLTIGLSATLGQYEPPTPPNSNEAVEVDATDNAKAFAAEKGVDLSKVTGTGTDGRIGKPDVEKYLADNAS